MYSDQKPLSLSGLFSYKNTSVDGRLVMDSSKASFSKSSGRQFHCQDMNDFIFQAFQIPTTNFRANTESIEMLQFIEIRVFNAPSAYYFVHAIVATYTIHQLIQSDEMEIWWVFVGHFP